MFSHGLFLRAILLTLITGVAEATPDFMRHYAYFIRALHMPNAAILQVNFAANAPTTFTGFRTEHLVDN